jgi:predicted aldo/keto reductase-like oxidoreductase
MKRRDFLRATSIGPATMAGCSGIRRHGSTIMQEIAPIELEKRAPRPTGTMPTGELGTTGIRLSKFGFGSHMRADMVVHDTEREWMIREAHDMGTTLFDVYDSQSRAYQYEPMGRYLAPVIHDVQISIFLIPSAGRSMEEEFERALRVFGKDCIDLVRLHTVSKNMPQWAWWDTLLKWKEEGKIRAIGMPIHRVNELDAVLEDIPIDYVIFPFNFYHNWTWASREKQESSPGNYDDLITLLQERGIGAISMKPFAGDHLAAPFKRLATDLDESGTVAYAPACLRYVLNSGLPIDATLCGMFNPYQVHENIAAYYNPGMSDAENSILLGIRQQAREIAERTLPPHYRFLNQWASTSGSDSDLCISNA